MRTAAVIVVCLAGIASGCATSAGSADDLVNAVRRKASFELNCGQEQLAVSVLSDGQRGTNLWAATNQKSFGVLGCGRRASYYAWCVNMVGSTSCDAVQSGRMPEGSPR